MTEFQRLAAFIFCLGFIGAPQSGGAGAQSEGFITDGDSYAVFAAALSITSDRVGRTAERVTLLQETRPVTTCPTEKAVPPEWRSVVRNHKTNNVRIRTLRQGVDLGRPYSLISMAELRSLMRSAGYDLSRFSGQQSPGAEVFRGLPGGRLVALSAVGFDAQKTRAMVTLQYDCFPRAENQAPSESCHSFHQLMFEKHDAKWIAARGVATCSGVA
jgi:hypothetical protein